MSWSWFSSILIWGIEETLVSILHVEFILFPKCCWKATKRSHFCIGLLLVIKNGSITQNTKGKKSYVKPGQPAKSTAKPNIHDAKIMLSIWWDQKGVLYCELLKPGDTINGERYRTQLFRLKRAIDKKRPEYATRHEAIIFHI